ncbi:MAG: hypothetical protein M3P11_11135 [Actinomycetota bacterium]|nr:hypothetical protein [Actinomycetota bacterium]
MKLVPCEPAHFIDHDPCPNCGSTHTVSVDETATANRCLNCGEIFDVASVEYQAFSAGLDRGEGEHR